MELFPRTDNSSKLYVKSDLNERKKMLELEHTVNRELIKNDTVKYKLDEFVSYIIYNTNTILLFDKFMIRYDIIILRIQHH